MLSIPRLSPAMY